MSRTGRTWAAASLATVAASYAALQVLGRTSGSTSSERARALPGDQDVAGHVLVTNHAGTLPAPPSQVWPWLTQMGWHRAGWYTPAWVDRLLFPANWPSSRELNPEFVRDLVVGDTIPDGPPGTAFFVVDVVDAPRLLVLHSRTHLPPGWDERFGAALDWVWTFDLRPIGTDRTRLLIRSRGRVQPAWLHAGYVAAIVPADHVMSRGMLHGLSRRVSTD